MKKTILYAGIAVLSLVVTTAIVSGATYAFQGKQMSWRNHDSEQHMAISTAMENNDYNAWVTAVGENCPIVGKISEADFVKLTEAHKLRKSGDMEGAQAIMGELGVERPIGDKAKLFMKQSKNFDPVKMETTKIALENNDYNAWLEAVGVDSKIAQKITAENFAKFVEVYQLKQAGDYEGARELMEELGFNYFGGKFSGHYRAKGYPVVE